MKWEEDKKKNFSAGLVLSGLGGFWWPLIFSGFVAGVAKEVYDRHSGRGTPEVADIYATWIGSAVGTAFSLGFCLLT